MNIETIKENLNASMHIGHETKKLNVEGEVNVPDIKPDILSIINITGRAFITKKEIIDDRVKVDGTVDVFIIYLSDDEQSTLRGINNTFNFTEYIDLPKISEKTFIKTRCNCGTLECKVINGRKLNVKCPVSVDIDATEEQKCEIGKDVADDRNVEIKKENMSLKTLHMCKSDKINISENINLGEECKPIGEILRSSIQIVEQDYKTSYNKILAKAEAIIRIIYIADDEKDSVETFETKVPVMGFIDVDELTDDMEINIDYNVKSFCVKPVYQDLKASTISIDSEIEICMLIYKKIDFAVISDLYSIDKKVNLEYNQIQIMQNSVNSNEKIIINQDLLIPELETLKILDIDATPSVTEINILDGKLALEGNIEFNILYYKNDKHILENKKMELPFQQVIKIQELKNNMKPEINLDIDKIEYKTYGGNQVQIQISMKVSVLDNETKNVKSIKNIEITEEELPNMPSIVVYYVKAGDTLWKIAKKFRTTVCKLKELNSLTDDTIYPNQELIIMNRKESDKAESLL